MPPASSDAAPASSDAAPASSDAAGGALPKVLPVPTTADQAVVDQVLQGKHPVENHTHRKARSMAAEIIEDLHKSCRRDLLLDICKDVSCGKARGVAFLLTRMYDETPLKCRVLDPGGRGPSSDAGGAVEKITAKVVAHFRGFALTVAYGPTYHRIVGQLPTKLRVVDKQTLPVVHEMLRQFRSLDTEIRDAIVDAFPRRAVLSTADSHQSNVGAEHRDAGEHAGWTHLFFRCSIHRVDTCEKRTLDLTARVVSGVVNLGLYFSSNMLELREKMRQIISEDVVWVRDISESAKQRRKQVENLFASGSSSASSDAAQQRRLAWRVLFNGDLGEDKIQHLETGCCKDLRDTVDKMCTLGMDMLCGRYTVWSRKSWTGHDDALDFIGALESTHRLLSRAVERHVGKAKREEKPADGDTWHTEQAAVRQGAVEMVLAQTF